MRVRTCTPQFYISGTAGPIGFKFGVWLGTTHPSVLHMSGVGCFCACARAHPYFISQERLGQLRSNFVCGWGPIILQFPICQTWVASARAHVHTPILYFRNGWADCVQTLCLARDPSVTTSPQVVGVVALRVRACIPLVYISGSAGPIVLKFGVWPETHQPLLFHKSLVSLPLRLQRDAQTSRILAER